MGRDKGEFIEKRTVTIANEEHVVARRVEEMFKWYGSLRCRHDMHASLLRPSDPLPPTTAS